MSRRIILCEPVCEGFEHAEVNAAILATALFAYPGATILFLGKESHLDAVRHSISKARPDDTSRVEWRNFAGAARASKVIATLRRDYTWCRDLFTASAAEPADFLLLCTVTDSGLFALKRVMAQTPTPPPVLAFIHGILATVETAESAKWWRKFVNLRLVLGLKHPDRLRNIALGAPIHAYLQTVAPRFAPQFRPLELPCLWAIESLPPPREEGPAAFGFYGVDSVNKGFDRFHALACEAQKKNLEARFVLAGFLRRSDECGKYGGAVEGVGHRPLSREEYSSRAVGVDYALWTGEPRHYNLTASATFLDALSHVRPGIYLSNRYIEYYFDRMGDIGYLCGSCDEMFGLIEAIAKSFPAERHRQQCENILRGRALFEPETLAPKLRAIVEEI